MTSSFFPIYVTVSSFETVRNHIIFMRKQHSAGHYRNQNPKISIACLIHYCSCFFQQGEGRKPNAINQKRRSGNGNDDVCHLRDSSMSGRSTSGIPLFLHQHHRQKPSALISCCAVSVKLRQGGGSYDILSLLYIAILIYRGENMCKNIPTAISSNLARQRPLLLM